MTRRETTDATLSATFAASAARMRPTHPRSMLSFITRVTASRAGLDSGLCFMGHLLMENGDALIVDAALTRTSSTAEREAALAMVGRRITLGADRAYDVTDFVDALRALTVTPHITVDGHVTKTGKQRKTQHRGRDRVG